MSTRQFAMMCFGLLATFCGGCIAARSNHCSGMDDNHPCLIPFELLYSDREALLGRVVRVEGVLLVGSEADDKGRSRAILFSSRERAEVCNTKLALEIVGTQVDVSEQLKRESGNIISIAGRLVATASGEWARLEAIKLTPLALAGSQNTHNCLRAP